MSVSVIIPAFNAADTVGATVSSARSIPEVAQVIVVDDGSSDDTASASAAAGADQIVRFPANKGKGAALAAGVAAAAHPRLLFLDADLGASASHAAALLAAAPDPEQMSVAVFPSLPGGGGLGLAMGLARFTLRLLSGLQPSAPMSGQRALSRELVRHVGLAPRFGVEVALTVEAALAGATIQEIPVPLEHARTGRSLAGFIHRGRQFLDILRYLLLAGYGIGWPALPTPIAAVRALAVLAALILIVTMARGHSPAAGASTAAGALVAAALWLPCLWCTSVSLGLRRANFFGRSIPSAAGAIFPLVGVPLLFYSPLDLTHRTPALIAFVAFGVLGLADDIFGGEAERGLRGHLRALVRGRVTTGSLKAVGGLAAGVGIGYVVESGSLGLAVLDGLLIALSANFVNLLDLRPGRALKGFLILSLLAISLAPDAISLLGPVLTAAVVCAPSDFSARTMLGDVGANVLGGLAGVALVLSLTPGARLAAVLVLLVMHIVSERHSLTDIIARNSVLNWLDRLGTTHLGRLVGNES
ncbi:MAG: glycosyltransferase family 2 protein [Armatimonadetes bacterium]|nr:glycosyltransferase family 2 protein [Armatimonadota bacterium]